MENSHWERSHCVVLLWSCSPVNVLCCVPFRLLCRLTKYTVAGTALRPTLTAGMPAIGLVDSQELFSPGHWCRSTEVRSQDCSSRSPGPAVGAVEAAQTLAWPSPHMYVSTEPTAAKARSVPAAGALAVLSDVSQVLNLGRRQWTCICMVHRTTRGDFSSSSLVTGPLAL